MRLYYMCLLLGLFLLVSFGVIIPHGVSANDTLAVAVTGAYMLFVVPWVGWRGVRRIHQEWKNRNRPVTQVTGEDPKEGSHA